MSVRKKSLASSLPQSSRLFSLMRSTSFMYRKYSRAFIGGLVAEDKTAGPLADLELGLEVRVWLGLTLEL